MKSEYLKKIEKLEEYNEYREDEVRKHIQETLENFKKNVADNDNASSVVNTCKQFIHDIEWYEQQRMVCGEVRKTLVELEIDFEKKDKEVKKPCEGCIYFKECGETNRTMPCKGRKTKSEQKKEGKAK